MKSLKSIAQQKGFELKKLEAIVEEMDNLIPYKAGSTLLFNSEDSQVIINTYYDKHVNVAS
jgi:hypothetical protein